MTPAEHGKSIAGGEEQIVQSLLNGDEPQIVHGDSAFDANLRLSPLFCHPFPDCRFDRIMHGRQMQSGIQCFTAIQYTI